MAAFANSITMSSKSLLVLLSFGLLCLALTGQTQKAFNKRSSCDDAASARALAKAMATGNKSCVRSEHKKLVRSFGLMHLLTPSGLHLSSALIVFYFLPKTKAFICFIMFFGSFFTTGLFSLQRMLLFQVLNSKIRNIKTSFFLTMIGSIILGNFQASPVSFSLSLLFWGAIVFHKGSKRELILSLYICQCLVAIAFAQDLNPLSLIINPIISALFTAVFPIFLLLYPMGDLSLILTRPFLVFLESLSPLMVLNCSGMVALIIGLIIMRPSRKWIFVLMVFCSATPKLNSERTYQSRVAPLPVMFEFLELRKRKAVFLDRACKFYVDGRIKCKKKPSNSGGPYL